jgi:hypothetical protein
LPYNSPKILPFSEFHNVSICISMSSTMQNGYELNKREQKGGA